MVSLLPRLQYVSNNKILHKKKYSQYEISILYHCQHFRLIALAVFGIVRIYFPLGATWFFYLNMLPGTLYQSDSISTYQCQAPSIFHIYSAQGQLQSLALSDAIQLSSC